MKNIRSVYVLTILVLLISACGGQSQPADSGAGDAPAKNAPAPTTPAEKPAQKAASPTQAKPDPAKGQPTTALSPDEGQAFSMQELLTYGDKGGGGDCFPDDQPLPQVYWIDITQGYLSIDRFGTCLVGFPPGELVQLVVIDPLGREIPWLELRAPEHQVSIEGYDQPFTQMGLVGFRTLALGSPDWRLVARYAGGEVTSRVFGMQAGELLLDWWWKAGERAVTQSRLPTGRVAHPYDPMLRKPYEAGETVFLQGVNFTPDTAIPLGLYYLVAGSNHVIDEAQMGIDMQFVSASTAHSDAQGNFEISLTIGADFPAGTYCVYYLDPGITGEAEGQAVLSSAVFEVYESRSWQQAHPDLPASNLRLGAWAVGVGEMLGNLRSGPGMAEVDVVIGKLPPGEAVWLLDGPFFVDELIWWEVFVESSHQMGYTAEGDGVEVWLAPSE